MKKIFLLIVILLGIWFLFFYQSNSTEVEQSPTDEGGTSSKLDPSSATFTFDGESVTLSNGESEAQDDSGLPMETKLLGERAYGDINKDKKDDVVILLAQSGGGSGIFIYAAAYVSGPINYRGTNAVFIGDRVSPQSVLINTGVVTVKYLDREEDEPFAAEPTVPTSKQFVFVNGELVEK